MGVLIIAEIEIIPYQLPPFLPQHSQGEHGKTSGERALLIAEIGVLLNSPPLAQAVHTTMDENLSKYAYKLVLDANKKITWQRQTPQGPVIYTKEPRMKWWQRAGIKMLSWLPIEGFM